MTSAFLLVVMFSNSGNYGLPVVLFAFGQEALAHATVYFVANAVATYSLGVFLASAGRRSVGQAARGVLKVPAVWGVVAAGVVLGLGLQLPPAVMRPVELLSGAALPTMLLVLGMQLERGAWPERPGLVALAGMLALVVTPILALGASHLLGLTGVARQAAIVQSGMPSAVLTTILALEFDVAPSFVTACVLMSTLASPITRDAADRRSPVGARRSHLVNVRSCDRAKWPPRDALQLRKIVLRKIARLLRSLLSCADVLPSAGHRRAATAHAELPRVLGFTSVVGILVGTVIGSGIFVAPNRIAELVGSPQLILAVWVVGGVLSFFGALAFAELGAAFPQAGGMYVYLRESYGSMVAFLFGWTLFFVIDSGAIATLSVAFSARYLPYFVPLSPFESKMVALALISVLVAVNILGVRYGAALQNVLMFIKFGAIVAVSLTVFALADGSVAHFVEPAPPGWSGALSGGLVGKFGAALVLSLWAYKGWEAVTFSSGEIRNPQRNMPLGLLAGTAVVIVLYIATNLAYLYVFPAGEIARSSRIAADAMNAAIGPIGASLIAGVILLLDHWRRQRQRAHGAARVLRDGARRRVLQEVRRPAPEAPDAARLHSRHRGVGRGV